jgi:hypothetical protein
MWPLDRRAGRTAGTSSRVSHLGRFFLLSLTLSVLLLGFAILGRSPAKTQALAGANNLVMVDQACDGFGGVTVRLAWQPPNSTDDQWVDVSSVNAAFVWDSFYGFGPFELNQSTTDRAGLTPSTIYYARVNTAVFPFWVPSNIIVFQTKSCSATSIPSGSPPQTCDAFGNVTVRFNWQANGGGDQWLDISTTGGNFDWGTFFGQGPYLPQVATADRGGLRPSSLYYARINTAVFPFWVPSQTLAFQTISCTAPAATATPLPTPAPFPTAVPTPTATPTP